SRMIPCLLFDLTDRSLTGLDRQLRRALSVGFPKTWSPPLTVRPKRDSPEEDLFRLYHAALLGEQQKEHEAVQELRGILRESAIPQLRARGLQVLVGILSRHSLDCTDRGEAPVQRDL